MHDAVMDEELGPLVWDSQLHGWEGTIQLESQALFVLFEADEANLTRLAVVGYAEDCPNERHRVD